MFPFTKRIYSQMKSKDKIRVLIVYYNFRKPGTSGHIGLGINALHSLKTLKRSGIKCDILPITNAVEIGTFIKNNNDVTHCLVEAIFLTTQQVKDLSLAHSNVEFLVRVHSQIGFLQVESGAIKLLREQILLQDTLPNFSVCSNSKKLTKFIIECYQTRCVYLPNLYFLEDKPNKIYSVPNKVLKISSFGALRLLKNHTTAAAAALIIAKRMNCNLEFYLNVNRAEHDKVPGGDSLLNAVRLMFNDLKWAKMIEVPWEEWPEFRKTTSYMDLCLQPSFTETFNLVTADACSVLVPSVVSFSIDWMPDAWKADPDTIEDIVAVGIKLLKDKKSGLKGYNALFTFCKEAEKVWLNYLSQ